MGPARCPYKLQGQTLHAGILGFIHPTTGAYMEFTAPLPEYFKHLLEVLPERSRDRIWLAGTVLRTGSGGAAEGICLEMRETNT